MGQMNLTVIGGGSVNWMKDLMRDVYLLDEIEGGRICLVDPNLEYASAVKGMLETFNRLRGKNFAVYVTDERRQALPGSDFVMTTFSPGTMDGFENDLEIPIKYGIRLPVSMTVGIPGISAALRTVPVAYEIVRDMEELCPQAWLLNVTNPMSCVIGAMHRASEKVRIIGMCHEFHGFDQYIGPALGLYRPRGMDILTYLYRWLGEQGFRYTVAGINHFIWLIQAEKDGEDALEKIREYARTHTAFDPLEDAPASGPFHNSGEAKLALCRQFGYLPLAGDRHLIEFYPSLCNPLTGYGMKWNVRKTTVDLRRANIGKNLAYIQSIARGETEVDWSRSGEEMTEIIRSILTGRATTAIVNAPNQGQIENMPRGAVVETLASVDGEGVHPRRSGKLPGAVGALCRLHAEVQQMTVEAALSGDRRLLIEAMSLDPSSGTADFSRIPELAEELIQANRAWLPRFFD